MSALHGWDWVIVFGFPALFLLACLVYRSVPLVATFGCRHCGSHRVLRHSSPEFDAFEAECETCPGMVAHHARIELLPVEAK